MKEINEIIPDIHQESTTDIVKLLMYSTLKNYNASKLVKKYFSKCMIIAEFRQAEGPPATPESRKMAAILQLIGESLFTIFVSLA